MAIRDNPISYEASKKRFREQKKLYHFTHFESIKLIFQNMTLQLSQINNYGLNDAKEIEYINPFFRHKVYICCFTNFIADYFWENYTKFNGKQSGKKSGVCIEFDMEKFDYHQIITSDGNPFDFGDKSQVDYEMQNKESDWIVRDASGLKVVYKDNPMNDASIDYEMIDFFKGINLDQDKLIEDFRYINNSGYVKERKDWKQEEEYRIRVLLRPKGMESYFLNRSIRYYFPNFRRIFINLTNQLDSMKLIICEEFQFKTELLSLCKEKGLKYEIISNS